MITVYESYKQDCVLLKPDSAMNFQYQHVSRFQAVIVKIPKTESRERGEEYKKKKMQ